MRCASFSLFTILCLMLAVAPATADTLYSNGPYNGTVDAWTINNGFSVSDSLSPSQCYWQCYVQGFNIVTWNFLGDNLLNLEMQLGSSSFGNDYADQVLSPSGSADLGFNQQYGYELWRYDFSFPGTWVPQYTSWITLSNAVASQGQPIFWDENSGPSSAYENSVGSIPSEAFTITGSSCYYCGYTPEPSSMMLFGSGILAVVGVLRRKLNR